MQHHRVLGLGLIAALLVPASARAVVHIEEIHLRHASFDARAGVVAPSAEAVAAAAALDASVRWNRFGTVQVAWKPGGVLGTLEGADTVAAVREWLRDHQALLGLGDAGIDGLVLERDTSFAGSTVRVLLFGQATGGVPVMHEGRVKVGVVDGQVFWLASSSIGEPGTLAAPTVAPTDAWLAAAQALGISASPADLGTPALENGWTVFDVAGLSEPARVRPVALGVPGSGAVPAWETIAVDLRDDGELVGYTTFVDATTGERLVGINRVQQAWQDDSAPAAKATALPAQTETFQGSYPPGQIGTCGPCHGPFTPDPAASWDEGVVVAHHLAGGDITFDVYRDDPACSGTPIHHQDLLTTPEQATIAPLPAGDYYVRVCPFDVESNLVVGEYAGTVSFQNGAALNDNPRWRYFPAYPDPGFATVDDRVLGCWFDTERGGAPIAGCDLGLAASSSHGVSWDFLPTTNTVSATTTGNASRASEAWGAHLSPGGPYQPVVVPASPADHRVYDFPWTNQWFESSCDPTILTHSGGAAADADIDAAIVNLFTIHNQVHDFTYHLGLREREGAAQLSNYGNTSVVEESDFELGNAQAGAVDGGWPAYNGRDNANQMTLNDGIPPLSNMYLWQTIGGAIYVPCVDGDFDAGVIAHEYGHLVQNRMVDPQNGLSGSLGRALGESWADLTAIAFLNQYDRVPVAGENRFAVGAYITDPERGIRNYAMNDSPLNLSNVGYDFTCETDLADGTCLAVMQVHSDGEIWSAVNFELREALTAKYDATFPSSDLALQKRCADGQEPPQGCPGNRRWSQLMHDAFLLVPASPSMVDARDAFLAADLARSLDPLQDWPSNAAELWAVFARRGFGEGASAVDGEDYEPVPSFASPLEDNALVRFRLTALEDGLAEVVGEVYVGEYEARATPIADTDPASPLGDEHRFAPGTYDLLVRADGHGHHRVPLTVGAGQESLVEIRLPTNWASSAQGASAAGAGVDHAELIDDTEATNWQRTAAVPSVDVEQPAVTVALAGRQPVDRVQVSGMLEVALGVGLQNRFSALHGFRLAGCDTTVADCGSPASYATLLEAPDAFPSAALRALVGDVTLRSFAVTPMTVTHLRFEALHNKCTGTPGYQGYLGVPGQPDGDPANGTDCRTGSPPLIGPKNVDVRAAELQAFSALPELHVAPLFGSPCDGLDPDLLFCDGFESGDTAGWSSP